MEADWARSEESWEEKASDVDDGISLALWKPDLGRGVPYNDSLDVIVEVTLTCFKDTKGTRSNGGDGWPGIKKGDNSAAHQLLNQIAQRLLISFPVS